MDNLKFRVKMFFKYKDLLYLLVKRDVELKYRRSFLGYLWSMLSPLMSMIVMVIVFSHMFSRGIENFPVYLISGNILFTFFRESSILAINSIITNAPLIKKIYVPKYIFTVSRITSSLVNLMFALGPLVIVMLVTGAKFTWVFPFIVIPIVELYVFAVGIGLFLAQANVFFRDLTHIWNVVILAWMYATPIFYSIESLDPILQTWIPRLNPLYVYITAFRTIIIDGVVPWSTLLLQGVIVAVAALLFGMWTFTRSKEKFILYI